MSTTIALAGNPNCGKTSIFNHLTGSSQHVGNWPGVTVEKKEGKLKQHGDCLLMDLPGIYSLSPYTLEEVVTREYLINERPDAIINIIDGSNLERNLYLTTQLLEVGIPVVVALNMMDIVAKNGDKIDTRKLSAELGCPVIETSALKGSGLKGLADEAVKLAKTNAKPAAPKTFSPEVEKTLTAIADVLAGQVEPRHLRWYAVKLFERDEKVQAAIALSEADRSRIAELTKACEAALDDDAESIMTNERYQYITGMIGQCLTKKQHGQAMTISDKIDRVVTNRILALPIFAAVMWLVYYVSIQTVGTFLTDFTNDTLVSGFQGWVNDWLVGLGTADWLVGLICDGIIAGVGAVLGFVPQMMVLFFFLSILEDCGYMARVAFIMDRIFRRFGLSGKSFIPMLIGSGCGVPAIMATRTIENERDRRMTIMTTTFIPCGAKLPIIALFAGALFPGATWVAPSAYFIGVAAIILSCLFLKHTRPFAGEPAPFVMELPQYHLPTAKTVLLHVWERAKAFIVKAGTIIFVSCAVIWFLQSFNWSLQMVDAEESILASIGRVIAPLFAPLGFGSWQAAVGAVTGLVAKENVVATLAVLYGIGEAAEDDPALLQQIALSFTQLSAFAYMVFNLLCAPCFAAIGAIRREMMSAKWTWAAILYQTIFAYIVALLIYQIGSLIL